MVLIKFFLFLFLAMPLGLQDPGSQGGNQIQATALKVLSPNHWSTRELLLIKFLH